MFRSDCARRKDLLRGSMPASRRARKAYRNRPIDTTVRCIRRRPRIGSGAASVAPPGEPPFGMKQTLGIPGRHLPDRRLEQTLRSLVREADLALSAPRRPRSRRPRRPNAPMLPSPAGGGSVAARSPPNLLALNAAIEAARAGARRVPSRSALPTGDEARGLGSGEVRAFLPLWAGKSFGERAAFGGGGCFINPGVDNQDPAQVRQLSLGGESSTARGRHRQHRGSMSAAATASPTIRPSCSRSGAACATPTRPSAGRDRFPFGRPPPEGGACHLVGGRGLWKKDRVLASRSPCGEGGGAAARAPIIRSAGREGGSSVPANKKLLVLPGDGIGPEVMGEVYRVIEWFGPAPPSRRSTSTEDLVGGAAYDAHGVPLHRRHDGAGDEGRRGAVRRGRRAEMGEPAASRCSPSAGCCGCARRWTCSPTCARPSCFDALVDASTLKPEVVAGARPDDHPRADRRRLFRRAARRRDAARRHAARHQHPGLHRRPRSIRVARVAFELARKRSNRVTSVEKANVMESGVLWREEVPKLHDRSYADVELEPHVRRQLRDAARRAARSSST